ncbi:TO43-3rc [Gymnopus androsaceus JB14]|uniref:TO43-3rc n=1 Tax=Gymnopus androsaceus JB14 TaxID=1447944 RepID=A0A6A4GHZ2_9AGAR|nr:TO43-3rc [Gymnopus androsaceus JB14]
MSLIQSAEAAQSSFERIPIIDLKHLNSPDASLQKSLAREIRKACIDVGFFYIQNHGLPGALIEDFLWESKEFFSLPLESKLKEDSQ